MKIPLTVPGDVQLHEVLEILYVRRQTTDFIVTETELSKPLKTEEVLKKIRKRRY